MKRKVITQWTCDKCGKVFENGGRISRPMGLCDLKIIQEFNYIVGWTSKKHYDLCCDCSEEFFKLVKDWISRKRQEDLNTNTDIKE